MTYANPDDYFREIYIKSNIVDVLEAKLRSRSWKKEIININSVTDCYQPLEEKEQIMPQILKLMIKYKNPITISTKSDLILRDYDLIDELGRLTYVNIACSLITTNEYIQKKLEPGTPSPQRRLNMIKEIGKSSASTGLHVMPVVPFLTDDTDMFNDMFSKAKDAKVDYAVANILRLIGQTRGFFFNFIRNNFSDLFTEFYALYPEWNAQKDYRVHTYSLINKLIEKHGLSSSFTSAIKAKLKEKLYCQPALFNTK